MARRFIPCLAAAVMTVAGAHAASAQFVNPYYRPLPAQTFVPQYAPYTPPHFVQQPPPYSPPNPAPTVVMPFNAWGSTIRPYGN